MESLIQVQMLLVCFVAVIKLSLANKWLNLAFALLLFGFTLWIKDFCSEETIAGISMYIEQKSLREYMAILLTLEGLIYMLYAFAPNKKVLAFYPSLLIFPILYYTETNLFFTFAGIDFFLLALLSAFAVLSLFLALPFLIRLLIPEVEIRLELLFLSSILTTIIGLLTTVDDSLSYEAPRAEIPLQSLLIALGLFILCFAIGYYLPHIKELLFRKK